MEAKAMARTVRIAPRKARLVIDLIRGKQVGEAYAILKHTPKAASPIVEKVLKSAIANAEHNLNLDINSLYVKEAYVNERTTPSLPLSLPEITTTLSPVLICIMCTS